MTMLNCKFEIPRTIYTCIVAVAAWNIFRISTGYGPRIFQLELIDFAGGRRFNSYVWAT